MTTMTNNPLRWLGLYLLPALLSVSLLSACSDDDDELAPLATPSGLSVTSTAATSLSFSWGSVANAAEYYCVLYKDGTYTAEQRVTDPTVTFTSLTPSTTYTLRVIAYAPIGCNCNVESSPIEQEATTAAPVRLSDISNIVVEGDQNSLTYTWDAVENAAAYDYTFTRDGELIEEGSTTETTLAFTGLTPGNYTLTLTATSDDAGYLDSTPSVTSSTIEETVEVKRWNGSFLINADWDDEAEILEFTADEVEAKTLVKNDDGSYTLLNAYDGVDVTFTIGDDGYATFTNANSKNGMYNYYTATDGTKYCLYDGGYAYGDLSDPDDLYVYWYAYNYATAEGTYDYFTYTTGQVVGMFYYQEDTTADPEYLWKKVKTLTINGDGTYTFKNLYADGYDFTFSINADSTVKILVDDAYKSSGYSYVYFGEGETDYVACYTEADGYSVGEFTENYYSVWWSRYDYSNNKLWGADYFFVGEWDD